MPIVLVAETAAAEELLASCPVTVASDGDAEARARAFAAAVAAHGAAAIFAARPDASWALAARVAERGAGVLVALAPTDPEGEGDVRAVLGDAAGAAAVYRVALDDAPETPRLARKLGAALVACGRSDEAVPLLVGAVAASRASGAGEEARCHLELARAAAQRGEAGTAVEQATLGLTAAHGGDRHDVVLALHAVLADMELLRGDANAAIRHADTADDSAASAPLRHAAGRAALRKLDLRRARDAFERALPLARGAGDAACAAAVARDLAAVATLEGRWADAAAALELALGLDGLRGDDDGAALDRAGLVELALVHDDLEAARAQLVGAPAAPAAFAAWSVVRGDVARRAGDRDAAREAYRAAAGLPGAPAAAVARRRLCELDLDAGLWERALDELLDLARVAQHAEERLEEARLHRVAAVALRGQGDLESAAWFVRRGRELAAPAPVEAALMEAEVAELADVEGRGADADLAFRRAATALEELGVVVELARVKARAAERAGLAAAPPAAAASTSPPSGPQSAVNERSLLERSLSQTLDELFAVAGAARGAALIFDDAGRPTARVARGSVDPGEPAEGPALAALSAQAPIVDSSTGAVYVPLFFDERAVGVVSLVSAAEGARPGSSARPTGGTPDLALLAAQAARAAVRVENARFHAGAVRRGELRAMLAHEVRNPLAGILGFSDLLPDETAELPAKYVHLMGRIHADAQRLKKLVEHLLDLIGPRDGGAAVWAASPPTRLAVAPLLAAVRRSFSLLAAPRGVRLVVVAPDALPDALVQGDRVTLAVANLVLNALAASPDGGTVTVRAGAEPPRTPGGSSDAWSAPHGYVRIEVSDEGPGIPAARRMLVVEEPPGLGLKVVREIVRRHGGSLRVDDAPSGGALVAFTIPAARRRR